MNTRLKVMLLKPRPLPPPDPQCRVFDFAQTLEIIRNHERSKQQSQCLHHEEPVSPTTPRKPQ